jgi:hypothetical protein
MGLDCYCRDGYSGCEVSDEASNSALIRGPVLKLRMVYLGQHHHFFRLSLNLVDDPPLVESSRVSIS